MQVQKNLGAFRERGAEVVAVGQGTGREAARMAEKLALGFPVLGDPARDSYASLDLARDNWWGLLVRPFLEKPVEAARTLADADFVASVNPRSDPRQLGGVAIVDAGGTVRYLHRAKRADDLPPDSELLLVLDSLR